MILLVSLNLEQRAMLSRSAVDMCVACLPAAPRGSGRSPAVCRGAPNRKWNCGASPCSRTCRDTHTQTCCEFTGVKMTLKGTGLEKNVSDHQPHRPGDKSSTHGQPREANGKCVFPTSCHHQSQRESCT